VVIVSTLAPDDGIRPTAQFADQVHHKLTHLGYLPSACVLQDLFIRKVVVVCDRFYDSGWKIGEFLRWGAEWFFGNQLEHTIKFDFNTFDILAKMFDGIVKVFS
jgi:hypothetical protein